MDKPAHLIEFETMLLSRHAYLHGPRQRSPQWRLERSAYVLLSRLAMDGPMSVRELRDAFGLDASTLHRQTTAMLRAGLVERIPDPDGGMARKFRVSPDGMRQLDHDRTANLDILQTLLADWSADEVTQFAESLRRYNGEIEKLEGRPWPRP
jgi:DNA-binding MarR family transcriptional regulator